jgi:hypothetical protein
MAKTQGAITLAHFIKIAKRKDALKVLSARKVVQQDDGKLKVLVDPAAQKLVQNTYKEYVSEEDYSDFLLFIRDFDALLAKYRKDKPLSKIEIEKIEDKQNGGKNKSDDNNEEGEEGPYEDEEEPEGDEASDVDEDVADDEEQEEEEPEDEDKENSIVVSKSNFIVRSKRTTAVDLESLKKQADEATAAAKRMRREIDKSAIREAKRRGLDEQHEQYQNNIDHFTSTHSKFNEYTTLEKEAAKARVAYRRASIQKG